MITQPLNSHRVDPHTAQKFYIDGHWSAPQSPVSIAVVNPATEEVVAHVASGSAADVDRAVAAARAAFAGWSGTSPEVRAQVIGRIHELIIERKEELAHAISLE
ncbi:aldehyde dehydrogenase family protein, partial [Pseudomonas syringae]|uniref:aldehyde dehydrogenase family protein n=1 Tax=Pseudomonas syringae TaxID=317 RepID=UPI000A65B956